MALTTDHNGMIISTSDRSVQVSLKEKAIAAGRIRAAVGGQMSRRDQLFKLLRCKPIDVTQEVWEAYRSAYDLEKSGVPF